MKVARPRKFWEVKAVEKNGKKTGELWIYGLIEDEKWMDEDVTAKEVADELEAMGKVDELFVNINSPGGSVWAGQAIHSILDRYRQHTPVTARVDGLAASIATVIMLASDWVIMPSNAMVMIHEPWSIAIGNAAKLRSVADLLDKANETVLDVYTAKVGDKASREHIKELMQAETWLSAQECYDLGLCDEIAEEVEMAACADHDFLARYRNTPERLKALKPRRGPSPERTVAAMSEEERLERIAAVKADLERVNGITGRKWRR